MLKKNYFVKLILMLFVSYCCPVGEIQYVSIKNCIPGQKFYSELNLKEKIRKLKAKQEYEDSFVIPESEACPAVYFVVNREEYYFLIDGNHTFLAAVSQGCKTVPVKIEYRFNSLDLYGLENCQRGLFEPEKFKRWCAEKGFSLDVLYLPKSGSSQYVLPGSNVSLHNIPGRYYLGGKALKICDGENLDFLVSKFKQLDDFLSYCLSGIDFEKEFKEKLWIRFGKGTCLNTSNKQLYGNVVPFLEFRLCEHFYKNTGQCFFEDDAETVVQEKIDTLKRYFQNVPMTVLIEINDLGAIPISLEIKTPSELHVFVKQILTKFYNSQKGIGFDLSKKRLYTQEGLYGGRNKKLTKIG